MSFLDFDHKPYIDRRLVIGSATLESTYALLPGTQHEEDATLTASLKEETFGGSGLCNAIAAKATGVDEELTFAFAAGSNGTLPDIDCQKLLRYLSRKNIHPHVQLHPGNTEKTMIFLSGVDNDSKRGFRIAQSNGSLVRDLFQIDTGLKDQLETHPLVTASSLHPSLVLKIASEYRKFREDRSGTFAWTLNKESALAIGNDKSVQESLEEGMVDMVFMSDKERQTIFQTLGGISAINRINTIVVTKNSHGCEVRDRLNGHTVELNIPAFGKTEKVNDNGAGEAHHNNFLSTLISVMDQLKGGSTDFKVRAVETAANIANLAGFLKIQQENSLWFPELNFSLIRREIMRGVDSPAKIARNVYEDFLYPEKLLTLDEAFYERKVPVFSYRP